jgi:hypothetical protein
MRAKVVHQIQKLAYGPDGAPRARKYYHNPRVRGTIIADALRRKYQGLKRAFKQGDFTL